MWVSIGSSQTISPVLSFLKKGKFQSCKTLTANVRVIEENIKFLLSRNLVWAGISRLFSIETSKYRVNKLHLRASLAQNMFTPCQSLLKVEKYYMQTKDVSESDKSIVKLDLSRTVLETKNSDFLRRFNTSTNIGHAYWMILFSKHVPFLLRFNTSTNIGHAYLNNSIFKTFPFSFLF